MRPPSTARARARAALTAEIKEVAGRHLATDGAAGLSLRAVARELGLSSSAVYRYFASRDELLTALIIDAYDSLGEAVERADASVTSTDHPARWLAASRAVREWALAEPQRYALVYGSPVPGYQAPTDTIAPAIRSTAVFAAIVVDAAAAGTIAPSEPFASVPAATAADLEALGRDLFGDTRPELVGRAIVAWTAVFGLVSFELFGQYRNALHHGAEFFDHAVVGLGAGLGLQPG